MPRPSPALERLPGLRRSAVRTTVFIAFGLTVGIWIFAGVYFGHRISSLEAEASAETTRYVEAARCLTAARSSVLLSSVYVRDALLEPTPATRAEDRTRVEAALADADQGLRACTPLLDSAAAQLRTERLQREIAELTATTGDLLKSGGSTDAADARPMLQDRVRPKREEVISVAAELGDLNRTTFLAHQGDIAGIYRQTQLQIWQIFGLAIVASFGVALLSARYAGRLERRVIEQHHRDLEQQQDLRRLSARLTRVRDQERRSVARELHDDIGQLMTAVKVELSVAQRALDERGGPSDLLDNVRPIADRALQAVRDLSHLLHPSVLDDLGLAPATEWFLKGVRRRHGVAVVLSAEGLDHRLAPDIETAAYRIIQGALSNVIRHAHATAVTVTLRCAGRLVVTIQDDGVGFASNERVERDAPGGLGLISMRERAAQIDGQLTIISAPGAGTRVIADLPALPATVSGDPVADAGTRGTIGDLKRESVS